MIKIRESLKFGWKAFWKNWPPFVALSLILAIVVVMSADENPFGARSLLSYVGMAVVNLGFITLSLKVIDGKKVGFPDIFEDYKLFIPFGLVSITYFILVDLGMFLLVVPGLFIGARLFAAPYLVIDKNISYVDSFRGSWKLTQGRTIKLILFEITLFGVAILGLLALLVGALVAASVMNIATAYVYRKLNP